MFGEWREEHWWVWIAAWSLVLLATAVCYSYCRVTGRGAGEPARPATVIFVWTLLVLLSSIAIAGSLGVFPRLPGALLG